MSPSTARVSDRGRGSSAPTTSVGRSLRLLSETTIGDVDRQRTGREAMSPEAWEKATAAARRLHGISMTIAEALERAGVVAFQNGPPITRIDLATRSEELLPRRLRNNNLFPSVMMANTRAMRAELVAYASLHRVSGTAIVFGHELFEVADLGARIDEIIRIGSRMAHAVRRKYGVDVFFVNTEITAHRHDGKLSYHVHCHMLIDHGFLAGDLYAQLIDTLKEFAPSRRVRASGFRPGDEAVALSRYCIKPDMHAELGMSDEETAALYHAVKKKRFYRPMGGFKAWRTQFQADRRPIVLVPNPADCLAARSLLTGSALGRPRRPATSIDLTGTWRRDAHALFKAVRHAASCCAAPASNPKDVRRSVIAEAIRCQVDPIRIKAAIRGAFQAIGGTSDLPRQVRRYRLLAKVIEALHAEMMRSGRTRTSTPAGRMVVLRDTNGDEPYRVLRSAPKQHWLSAEYPSKHDILVHRAIASPGRTSRMSPSVLIANRSGISVVALFQRLNLIQDHLKLMAVWNARCSPRERVPIPNELLGLFVAIDGHRVGALSNGKWVSNDSPAYRSESRKGKVYVYDLRAENEMIASGQSAAKGLMQPLNTTTARAGPSPQRDTKASAAAKSIRRPPDPQRAAA